MTASVLLVCLGNICRSPIAHGVLRSKAAGAGLALAIESAGTGNWHAGDPPDPRAQAMAAARGYDLSDLRARQVTHEDFRRFDLILAMDRANLRGLEALRPEKSKATLRLFRHPEQADVPDPYYNDRFAEVLDLVERGCDRLIAEIIKKGQN